MDGDDDERAVQEIESLCMSCHENVSPPPRLFAAAFFEQSSLTLRPRSVQGMTRLLLTSIPYFREVVVMSFRCEHCGESNTEIQSAGMIQGACARFRRSTGGRVTSH
jgi:zinc finger protein